MCGIIASYSKNDLINNILNNLEKIEYRGYDSAGISYLQNNKIITNKAVGNVSKLKKLLDAHSISNLAIGHTRWATHGKVSINNAHPHTSHNNIAIVHNGIIENYHIIKTKLIDNGYQFISDTDSETIAHLIHYNQQQHNNFATAFQQTIQEIKGNFTIVAINKDEPEKIYAVCCNSPLILGYDTNSVWLASDAIAINNEIKNIFSVPNNHLLISNKLHYELIPLKGTTANSLKKIKYQQCIPTKAQHKHFMLHEIYEQPQKWHAIITQYINSSINLPTKPENIHIVGCGSSFNSALTAQYWLESIAKCPTKVFIASEYNQQTINVPKNCILILPSQSGETADTLLALHKAKSLNYSKYIALCNVAHSSLARQTDNCIHLSCGPEVGVASTKAFTAQLWAFYALVTHWSKGPAVDLAMLTQIANKTLSTAPQIQAIANTIYKYKNILFIGSNVGYPIAQEAALKLKEISYIHSHAYPAGELKHGPLALIDSSLPVISLVMHGNNINKTVNHLNEIRSRSGKLIIIHQGQTEIINNFQEQILLELPKCEPDFTPMIFSIACQLLAYYTADKLNRNIDQPRNLAKSVTVE